MGAVRLYACFGEIEQLFCRGADYWCALWSVVVGVLCRGAV